MAKSILFVGVGGQGTILASKILTEGLLSLGYDVKMSEIHGMAQRGGSVTTQIKFGKKVYSPCIGKGEADVVLAFEKVEAVRWLPYLKEDGILLVNDYEIYSLPVLLGQEKYPENIIPKLKEQVPKVKAINAAKIAEDLGNIKAQNIVQEFMITLNMDYEISRSLYNLYDYFYRRLVEANIKKDQAIVEEVKGLLTELRQTFAEASIKARTEKQINLGGVSVEG